MTLEQMIGARAADYPLELHSRALILLEVRQQGICQTINSLQDGIRKDMKALCRGGMRLEHMLILLR